MRANRTVFVFLALAATLFVGTEVAASASRLAAKVPCAKLKRLHRKLPPRCRAKTPPSVPALPGTPVPPTGTPPWQHADPSVFAASPNSLWVGAHVAGAVYRVDPRTNAVVATVTIPGIAACGIAATETAVWAGRCKFGDTGLVRIDPATNAVAATIAGPQACGVAVGNDAVWVSDVRDNSVWRIDPASNAVVAKIALPAGTLPCGPVVAAYGSVWVAGVGNGTVSRIDPATNAIMATIQVGASNGPTLDGLRGPENMTAGAGFVWVGNDVDERLYRINPLDNGVTTFDVGATDQGFWRGFSVSFGMGNIWARTGICEAAQVDPATGAVIKRISLCNFIYDQTGNIEAAFDSLWVAYPESGRVQRIQP